MWNVNLGNVLHKLDFEFEHFADAVAFIERAIKSNNGLSATISFTVKKTEGEE